MAWTYATITSDEELTSSSLPARSTVVAIPNTVGQVLTRAVEGLRKTGPAVDYVGADGQLALQIPINSDQQGTLLWTIHVYSTDQIAGLGSGGTGAKHTQNLGTYAITASTTLAQLVPVVMTGVTPTLVSDVAAMVTAAETAETNAESAATTAAGHAAAALSSAADADSSADLAAVSEANAEAFATGFSAGTATSLAPGAPPTLAITGPAGAKVLDLGIPAGLADDASMTAVAQNPASAFATELSATYVPRVSPTKHAPALNLYFPEAEGAVADGVTDCTAAITATEAAAPAGATVYFQPTGSGSYYKITDTITITTANRRWGGPGRDMYASSIRCTTAGKTMVAIKAPGFVCDMSLQGDGGTNGAGATVNGLDFYGDTDGNIDADVATGCLIGLAVGVRSRGRNLTIEDPVLVTNCLRGVVIDGKDATYHTGPNADQIRGHHIGGRYHGCGNTTADAAIEVLSTAKILHAVIAPKLIDSTRKGRGVVVTGTAVDPAKGLTIDARKITEAAADSIVLTYVNNSAVLPVQIMGETSVGNTTWGNGIVLDNCNNVDIYEPATLQTGKCGVKITNSTEVRVRQPRVKVTGLDTSTTYDGISIDAASTDILVDDPYVRQATGYGIGGSPTTSRLRGGKFLSNSLGSINSTTLHNQASEGANTYVEGKFGRGEDRGRKAIDLAAGVATDVATVTGGGNFASFFVRVRFSARAGGACYVAAERVVFTENGVPTFTTIGTDATALCTIAFATSAASAIKVTLTATNAASGTVMVETYGAGASNTTNPRSATVAML